MVWPLVAVAAGASLLGGVVGAREESKVGRANRAAIEKDIEITKLQSSQAIERIGTERAIMQGQMIASAAASGVSVGSASVQDMILFNAKQRGIEISRAVTERDLRIERLRAEQDIVERTTKSRQRQGLIGGVLGAATSIVGGLL